MSSWLADLWKAEGDMEADRLGLSRDEYWAILREYAERLEHTDDGSEGWTE